MSLGKLPPTSQPSAVRGSVNRDHAGRPETVRIIQWAESWGGMEHNNTQLAYHLLRRGAAVTITAVGEPAYSSMPRRYAKDVTVEEIPWSKRRPPGFVGWYRIMRSRPADVAVFPKNWWAKGGVGMMLAACLAYRRVIVREHVAVPEVPAPSGERYWGVVPRLNLWYWKHIGYARLLSACPERIICVSESVRRRLIEGCGYPSDRTVTVYNAVDTSLFRSDQAARRQLRNEWGLSDDTFVLGAVGRIDNSHKRHDVSIRLFRRLLDEYPHRKLHFVLVGDGPDRAGTAALVEELQMDGHVTIAPFTPEPWAAYNALDVFLMPSAFEAFGLALAEAMACECLVIGMAVEGIGEILNERGIGVAVAADDVNGFFEAMRSAVSLSLDERRQMGRAARESVVRRFEAQQQYDRIIDHILGVSGCEVSGR